MIPSGFTLLISICAFSGTPGNVSFFVPFLTEVAKDLSATI
jgi:hypothetical protein